LRASVLAAGDTNPMAQMKSSAVFAKRKSRFLQSEVAPSIVPMASIGAHSYYHGLKAYHLSKNLQTKKAGVEPALTSENHQS